VIFVLDFRLSERGTAVNAPVDRLLALVDHPLLDEPTQRADDRRLVLRFHGQVRVAPFAEHPEALEVFPHQDDVFLRVRRARTPKFGHRHDALLGPELAIDPQLDGKPVTIPAGHIWGVVAEHAPTLDHKVFENFVQGGPDVDRAICVRWPVVQHELWRASARTAELAI
jgi:hypothetical protein